MRFRPTRAARRCRAPDAAGREGDDMDKMRYTRGLALAALPLAALCGQPASAQLPGLEPFPCHVLHVTNQTHNPALVTVSIDAAGISRVGAGMVDACTSGDIQLAPNLRCGVTFN